MEETNKNSWHIKSRYLFLILIISYVMTNVVWDFFSPGHFEDNAQPLSDSLFSYVFYFFLMFLVYKVTKIVNLDWGVLIGEYKTEYFTSKYVLMVLPLAAISFFALYLVYYPLSFFSPDFVNYWLIDDDINIIWSEGVHYKLANAFSFFDIVIIAPIIEEIFFRGFLLTSLANRWGIKKAIIISSIVFGVGHSNILGAAITGIFLSLVYSKTKSLIAPIVVHIANNTIVFIAIYSHTTFGSNSNYTITDFQNEWWMGLIGLLIGLPWLIYFYRKEISNSNFSIPYFNTVRV